MDEYNSRFMDVKKQEQMKVEELKTKTADLEKELSLKAEKMRKFEEDFNRQTEDLLTKTEDEKGKLAQLKAQQEEFQRLEQILKDVNKQKQE